MVAFAIQLDSFMAILGTYRTMQRPPVQHCRFTSAWDTFKKDAVCFVRNVRNRFLISKFRDVLGLVWECYPVNAMEREG